MNFRMIARILSRVTAIEAVLMGLSALVSMYYEETFMLMFGVPIVILIVLTAILGSIRPKSTIIYAREGFWIVAVSWILVSLIGAVPFWITGALPTYLDAVFETISGFTTTGATVFSQVEQLPKGLLFWRSLTHWIGGMGVLVFLMAVVPMSGDRSMHLMRAEAPGPSVGKLVPRARSTALILYGIYCALTLAQVFALLMTGMPLFDSVTTAFATAGTGGFSVKDMGIIDYHNPAAEIIITVFMVIFGVNFNIYYLLIAKKSWKAFKSEELKWYLGIYAGTMVLVLLSILRSCSGLGEALRLSAFQCASIMSTTGFATADFALWPAFSQSALLLLMIVGSCAGSTGGGLKISRVVILVKTIRREIVRTLHPRVVQVIKFEKKPVMDDTVRNVLVYLAVYCLLLYGSVLLVSLDGYDHTTNLTSVLATLGNVGPGLAKVGPMENFGHFSNLSKIVFCVDMLLGRLEIFPLLLLFSKNGWKR